MGEENARLDYLAAKVAVYRRGSFNRIFVDILLAYSLFVITEFLLVLVNRVLQLLDVLLQVLDFVFVLMNGFLQRLDDLLVECVVFV